MVSRDALADQIAAHLEQMSLPRLKVETHLAGEPARIEDLDRLAIEERKAALVERARARLDALAASASQRNARGQHMESIGPLIVNRAHGKVELFEPAALSKAARCAQRRCT